NDISAYTVDAITGAMTPVPGSPFSSEGTSPTSAVPDPSGWFVFVTNSCADSTCANGSVSTFTVDATTGALSLVSGSPVPSGGSGAISVNVSPSGKFVYVANQCNSHDSCDYGTVSVFSVDAVTGTLTAVPGSPFPSGGYGTASLIAEPSGRFVYVAN